MTATWDVIVVGSGFGGAVTACRLAEQGQRVLVLERGRRWTPDGFPRRPEDDWLWDHRRPHRQNGWVDFRLSLGVCTVQGAGVGGGSLIYANVCIDPPPDTFEHGWPREITAETIAPYLRRVEEQLRPTPVPANQVTQRFELMREGAEKIGFGDRFRGVPLAVTFDPEWHYGLPEPHAERHSKPWTNAQGLAQGTCVHCGDCVAGCLVGARNTLDLNYIPRAEAHGAEVRPLHLVRFVARDSPGYRVVFDRLEGGRLRTGQETARRVVLAAGSMGTTELLLRCRDEYRTLPGLSGQLGYHWSTNGDHLTFSFHDRDVSPTRGPTISAAIDLLDGAFENQQLFIEDGGFPEAFREYADRHRWSFRNRGLFSLVWAFGRVLAARGSLDRTMVWFGQGVDTATGRLHLTRHPLLPWRKILGVRWDRVSTEGAVGAMIRVHKRLADATDGDFMVPHAWTAFRKLTTPHPLGGCRMGTRAQNGVVDHAGEVFGYPGLFVADGAIIPKAIGLNPSKTIAALAERIADLMGRERRPVET